MEIKSSLCVMPFGKKGTANWNIEFEDILVDGWYISFESYVLVSFLNWYIIFILITIVIYACLYYVFFECYVFMDTNYPVSTSFSYMELTLMNLFYVLLIV